MVTNFRLEFAARYATAIQLYEKAHKRLSEGDADDTLTAARKSLEFFAKDFCKKCGMPVFDEETGKSKSIEDLVNTLTEYGFLKDHESAVLHQLRKLGNVGSHDLGNMDEAREAVALLEKTVMIFAEKDAFVSSVQETARITQDYSHLSPRAQCIAKSPILYRMFCSVPLMPFLPALLLPYLAVTHSAGVLLTTLSLMGTVLCMLLHNQGMAYLDMIPTPEKGGCKFELMVVRCISVIIPPVVMFCLLGFSVIHPSFFVKILIWATVALCCYINPILQNIFKKLRSRMG